MGVYEDRILPRVIDVVLGRPMQATRARVAAGLEGAVLEVGFGSGRNLEHLPDGVSSVLAVEPSAAARSLARRRIDARGIPVEFVGLDGQSLPLDEASVGCALVTWSLCTIPDPVAALRELHRVLSPGGRIHLVEHGRSPRPEVAALQRGLTPVWRHAAGGCRLDRPILDLLDQGGFDPSGVRCHLATRPAVFGWFYEGVAVKR